MSKILIKDPTLRDGNHAVSHQLNAHQIELYCAAAESAKVPIVEVGHGNGLGASSLQVGTSLLDEEKMLSIARKNLSNSKLGVFIIPGFGTIHKNLEKAIKAGVDVVSVACHCTEADTSERHISYVLNEGKEVYGVLMMSHMASKEVLAEEAYKMESYGAEGVIIMDSSGTYFPNIVTERIEEMVDKLSIPIGFHGHNNLGLSIANSLAAVDAGATILEGTVRGFGAGAGNTQLEVLIPVLEKIGYKTDIDIYKMFDAAELAEKELMNIIPTTDTLSIASGLAGVFSGFKNHVQRISKEYNVDPRDLFFELGKRQIVAGQEDIIIEVALELSKNKKDLK